MSHKLFCAVPGCNRDQHLDTHYCVMHQPSYAQSGMLQARTFLEFMEAVRDLMEGKAKTKGYHASEADGPNQLFDFISTHFPGHALGEIVYKTVRYQSKRDPTDLLKIAAWAFLEWKHNNGTHQW